MRTATSSEATEPMLAVAAATGNRSDWQPSDQGAEIFGVEEQRS